MRVSLVVILVLAVCILHCEAWWIKRRYHYPAVKRGTALDACAKMDKDMVIIPEVIQTVFEEMDGRGNGDGILDDTEFQGFMVAMGLLKFCMDNN